MTDSIIADDLRRVNPEVSLTMMKLAIDRGFMVIPDSSGDHWFPLDFIVGELLGKSEKSFEGELADWRKSDDPFPEKHPGAKGGYYRLFEFLGNYYGWKTKNKGGG